MFSKLRTELSPSTGDIDGSMNGRQACAPRRREDVAGLKNVVAWESDPTLAEKSFVPQVLKVPHFDLDAANVGDALDLLRAVPTEFTKLVFWDPQYRQLLDEQRYGNEGINRGKRRKELSPMSREFISSCDAEIGRIIVQSGYCCRWVDEFQLLNGLFKIDGLEHVGVIHWNNGRAGMGKRIRPTGGSVVILQKPPIGVRAKRLAVRWKTLPMIRGVHYEKLRFPKAAHPHRKPIGLVAEIILAVTEPGDIIIDPAAGSFVVLAAGLGCRRRFLGTDILPTAEPE
jgi:site-specific DNA-methyltransferase (adenine-specific)